MPQAGWCRECGEWVWVDEQGGCQHGHGPECVDGIHEQADPSSPDELEARAFGSGEMPDELNRFNWGAFLLPVVWGVVYGSWQIVGVWALALMAPLLLASLVGGASSLLSNVILLSVASEIAAGVARLWAGANANRMLWRRDAMRLQVLTSARPRFTVERYKARQRLWTIWGAVIVGVSSVVAVPFMGMMWQEYELTYVGGVMPLVWLAAEVLLALWLDARVRAEPPDLGRTEDVHT